MPEPLPPKIIIVDDEVAQMRALCETLRDHGYDTVGFSSPDAALLELRKTKFDLLLSDLMMPETNGIQLLQAALKEDPGLVGIIMTGEGSIGTAVDAMKSGALDYILKPFKLSAILPVLDRALGVRRLRLENEALERQVRERTVQLEAVNRELEMFSYSVSHDLRAPIRRIDGFLSLALDQPGCEFPAQTRDYLRRAMDSAKEMGRLIDCLLAFSRMGRAALHQVRFDPNRLVKEVIEEMSNDLRDRTIEWNLAPLPAIRGDPDLLKQVWVNLLSNAVKYSRPRSPARIEVGCSTNDGGHEFFVKDNGVGFDMRYANKLFGVFQRLHRAEEFEGTGIGLANVQQIVIKHGGQVRAESEPGEGAIFYFTLPG